MDCNLESEEYFVKADIVVFELPSLRATTFAGGNVGCIPRPGKQFVARGVGFMFVDIDFCTAIIIRSLIKKQL